MSTYIPTLSIGTAVAAVSHLQKVLPPPIAATIAQISTAIGLFVLQSNASSLGKYPQHLSLPSHLKWTVVSMVTLAGIGFFFEGETRTTCFKTGAALGLLQGLVLLRKPDLLTHLSLQNDTNTILNQINQNLKSLKTNLPNSLDQTFSNFSSNSSSSRHHSTNNNNNNNQNFRSENQGDNE